MGTVDWNDKNLEKLRELWDAGLSCNKIADQIPGATRSAIIGKVHRLGLHKRSDDPHPKMLEGKKKRKVSKPMGRPIAANVVRVAMTQPTPPKPIPPVRKIEEPMKRVEYLQLEQHHCRQLLEERGSDGLLLSCGRTRLKNPSTGGYASSYCPAHDRINNSGRYQQR